MELSKIIETKNLKSATIHVKEDGVLAELFISGINRKTPIKKKFKSLDCDINIPEISNWTVKHLGIKKYFYLKIKLFM